MEVSNVASFIAYWQRIHGRTERVVTAIPHDTYDWRPTDHSFSFADLIRHLAAIERFMFVENACGRWSAYPGHGPELAAEPQDVLALYRGLHDESVQLVANLTDADLKLACTTPGGTTMSRGKWLRAMIEHEVHHRGQLYLMLKLVQAPTPPLYGLTSEQVKANSTPSIAR